MRSLASALSQALTGVAAHLAGSSAAAEEEVEVYDGPDHLTGLLSEDVKTLLAVNLLSPVDVARLACTWCVWLALCVRARLTRRPRSTSWRGFVRNAGVWRLKHAALNLPPPLPDTATPGEALAALCRALELHSVVAPATACTIAWQDEPRHWERAETVIPTALCPTEVMALKHVFWLDIISPWVSLPPGVWLLRFRVMNCTVDQLAAPGLLVRVEAEEKENTSVRCEQAEHWPRSPLDGVSAHEVDNLIQDMTHGERRHMVESKVRRLMMAPGPGVVAGKVLRPQNPLNTWLYVSAGLVHVPDGQAPARVRARMFDHGGNTVYNWWLCDCVQAVPLHDPTRWPMPDKAVRALVAQ